MDLDAIRYNINRLLVWGSTEPILTCRRILWVVTVGWALAVAYVALALLLLASLVFAPFSLQAFRLALLALDGGITLEPYSQSLHLSMEAPAWNNPAHPYSICANIVWAVLFGWALALAHVTAALTQALTIIGLGTALANLQLALFALWPFGRPLRQRELPTTLEKLLPALWQQRAESASASEGIALLGVDSV